MKTKIGVADLLTELIPYRVIATANSATPDYKSFKGVIIWITQNFNAERVWNCRFFSVLRCKG